jgi:arginine decarboxylase
MCTSRPETWQPCAEPLVASRRATQRPSSIVWPVDHSRAPLLDALADYHRKDRYGFSPPGHRQGRGADDRVLEVLGREPFRADVLASGGLDDWRSGGQYLEQAQELMADAVGASAAFFSTCGSSLSVRAAMMAVAGGTDGGLLVPRDSHRSIVGGLIFSGIQPRWITPRWDVERHFCHPPSPERVSAAWDEYPDAAGALIVSPSPYGTCADLARIADICHQRGKPLIVDEAWGAHLPFHPDLPTWAMDAGADICVVSVHKMGAGFEQGSVYHAQGDLVDHDRLAACADQLMTTSPNVMIYAALDGWRRQMVQHGRELLGAALNLADDIRDRISEIPDVDVMEDELLGTEASHDLDRLQVLLDVSGTATSGYQARDWLRRHRHIDVGLADHRRILATLSFADDQRSAARLVGALAAWRDAAESFDPPPQIRLLSPEELQLDTVMLPREAFFAPIEVVPAAKAAGRIAAEPITPYPPGVPVVVPGERLNHAVVEYLQSGIEAGMTLPDPADRQLQHIRVVA